MTDEIIMAKVQALIDELKELGVEDFIFAAGNEKGFLGVQYDGEPKGIAFLAMTSLMNIMFDAMTETALEVAKDGRREDHSE